MRLYLLHRGCKKSNAKRTNNLRSGRDLMKENWGNRKTAKHVLIEATWGNRKTAKNVSFDRSYDFLAIVLLSQITLAFLDFCSFVCMFVWKQGFSVAIGPVLELTL